MSSPKVDVAIKNCCWSVGEGPHWEDATQSLLYVDIKYMDVHRWNSVTDQDTKLHMKDTVSLVVPRHAGGYIIGLGRRLSLLEWDTATATTIVEVDQNTGNRFNDGKCDARGRLWAGTMGFEMGPGKFEPEAGSLFSLDLGRTIRHHIPNVHISNGLAWTDDNKTMFYIDSIPRKVYAFDFDLEKGVLSNQRVAVDFNKPEAGILFGFPDGMTIDRDGNIWVAVFGAGAVVKFDPQTGKNLQQVDIPAKQTTSVCWGGKNLDEMYVTCARVDMSEEEIQRTQPLAGSIFKVTGLGTKASCPAYVYEG